METEQAEKTEQKLTMLELANMADNLTSLAAANQDNLDRLLAITTNLLLVQLALGQQKIIERLESL